MAKTLPESVTTSPVLRAITPAPRRTDIAIPTTGALVITNLGLGLYRSAGAGTTVERSSHDPLPAAQP